jgi:hypothetical protein
MLGLQPPVGSVVRAQRQTTSAAKEAHMKKKMMVAAVLIGGIALGAGAGSASAHPLNPPGNDKTISIGGPLGSSEPGDGAQGHWRGIDCNAANGKTPITPLGICIK